MTGPKIAMTPDLDAHLAGKKAALIEQGACQVYLLFTEDEARAVIKTRSKALAEIRRQAKEALRWFAETDDERAI